jgi:hypothetical protein
LLHHIQKAKKWNFQENQTIKIAIMERVIKAKYIKDYIIELTFGNKTKAMVNLRDVICNDHRVIFQELTNKAKFKKFKVAMNTVVWDNGLDLAPEFLYNLAHQKIRKSKKN